LAQTERSVSAPAALLSGKIVTYRKFATSASFVGRGFAPREVFAHNVIAIPKHYPDAQVLLERWGLRRKELDCGQFYQINLYTIDFYNLPDDLFSDPTINWHGQQLGRKGLIAAAGIWIRNSIATVSTLQSDLCQQLYRQPRLKRLCKTRVDMHFRYWYAFLFNAILDFCIDSKLLALRCPTGRQVVVNTRKAVNPDLFLRIYDYPAQLYACHSVVVGGAQYWEIPVDANRSRVVPLGTTPSAPTSDARVRLCVFHDIEENTDTDISLAECADNLEHMLRIEKSLGVDATYNILGRIFDRKRALVHASNPGHSIGFHSFNHDIDDLAQLPKCRNVDLRVRGYRPPRSRITRELTNYRLTELNFEWLASSTRSLGHFDCRLAGGIVKIPIDLDDRTLVLGKPYQQWEDEVLARARALPFFSLGLHDCYAGKWLPRYKELLGKLLSISQLVSADAVCDSVFLDPPDQRGREHGLKARSFGLRRWFWRKS
jgi:hypothetical protein